MQSPKVYAASRTQMTRRFPLVCLASSPAGAGGAGGGAGGEQLPGRAAR